MSSPENNDVKVDLEKSGNGFINEAFESNDGIKPTNDDVDQNISNTPEVVDDIPATNEDDDDNNFKSSIVGRYLSMPIQFAKTFVTEYDNTFKRILIILLILGYIAYMIAALVINFQRSFPLLVIFCLVLVFKIVHIIRKEWGESIWKIWKPIYNAVAANMYWIKWVAIVTLLILLVAWIVVDTSKRPNQLISLAGYIIFVFALFLPSKYPHRVRWRPVFWGLGIQFVLGLFILRTEAGFNTFNWLGSIARTFLDFVDAGSAFVFGPNFRDFYFAFKVLPIIIYFSSFISVLFYFGAMQWITYKISWIMQFSLGTSATESLCAAGNIFVGQTESPLLIQPYIKDLTMSEMHAVMTCGFGTIAGSVLGAYLSFGIKAVYLITACVMAAPCALAISKLCYPETKKSKFNSIEGLKLDPIDQRNVIEAAFVGASSALPLVLNIAANIIAFISLLAAINAGLSWYGGLLGFPQLSFELICSYVLLPITYLMGIEWQDCSKCAELLGIKIFLNEFIAYEELSRLIVNKELGTFSRFNSNGTVNWISDRSEAVITYALCGFANISSIGIMLGGLGTMCPERQGEMAKIVVRALIAGIFVSILNACIAGFLYFPSPPDCLLLFSHDFWNGTDINNVYECCEIAVGNQSSVEACRCCDYSWTDEFVNLTCSGSIDCL